jgi:hypothetical protein
MAKKLPLGLPNFRKIIENDFLRVDKTTSRFRRTTSASPLSRPRRFGKSITTARAFSRTRDTLLAETLEGG